MNEKINAVNKWLVGEKGRQLALIIVIIALSFSSFFLGKMSVGEERNSALGIREVDLTYSVEEFQALQEKDIKSGLSGAEVKGDSTQITRGAVVASKNGKKYHYPWCGGAKNMKESNKIYFNSIAEARSAGYEPAKNCKGLE